MKRTCEWCGVGIVSARADARYCSSQHRVYAHRAEKKNPIPPRMLELHRWIRRTQDKFPITPSGAVARSNDPTTWSSYEDAARSSAGVGLGFQLGDGIGCIDLDHCLIDGKLTTEAAELVAKYPKNYIEISPSGDGLHIWGLTNQTSGTRRKANGLSIERYTAGQYITVTGNVYQRGQLLAL